MSIETTATAPAEATTATATDADQSTASVPETPIPGEEALGDPGKKALDAMKADLRSAREELAALRSAAGDKRGDDSIRTRLAEAATLREELAELKAKAEGREAEYAKEKERRNVEAAALAKANERIRKAEVRAAAAGKLADPADALRYLDLEQFEVGNDGEVDTAAIAAAIADLVKSKPYLAAQGGPTTVFESPGAHRNGAAAGQLAEADLKSMTPEQIVKAKAEGRLNDLLGITS